MPSSCCALDGLASKQPLVDNSSCRALLLQACSDVPLAHHYLQVGCARASMHISLLKVPACSTRESSTWLLSQLEHNGYTLTHVAAPSQWWKAFMA
jgi:hypothetical protein